jgi:GNAT superfamily N-acetyltransferase
MIAVRRLTLADLPLVLRLRAQAGWNQTEADLRRFFDLSGEGSFIAEWDGQPAGTVCTFVFGSTAWIAMMLVEEALRGRGIGKALMQRALAFLDERRVERVRLDATPLGRPLYEKLGFVAEYTVLRHAGEVTVTGPPLDTRATTATEDQLRRAIHLDARVTDADRGEFLQRLYGERPDLFRVIGHKGHVDGFVAMRPGERAWFIGPCLATPAVGPQLLADAFRPMEKKVVYLDIPENNPGPIAAAEASGLKVQRVLTRMCRGPRPAERTDMIWASSGPEKG